MKSARRMLKPAPVRPEIEAPLKRSRELWDAMDEEEREAEKREQAKSWAKQDMD